MASKFASSFEDPHSNGGSLVGKADALKTKKKGGLGGRKPLGDLSNSGMPALTQASTKKPLKELIDDARNKKGFSKASDEVQNRSRKVLSDISNTQQSQVQKKNNTKLSVVAEEPHCPAAIAGEGFLHNHDECIKSQTQVMDMDEFLRTLGLMNDSSENIACPRAPALSSKFEPESPLRFLDVVEIFDKLDSSTPPCKSPKGPDCYADCLFVWEDCDFELMKTP